MGKDNVYGVYLPCQCIGTVQDCERFLDRELKGGIYYFCFTVVLHYYALQTLSKATNIAHYN